jgi:DeoR/GlpR family transcriptional regulator of sugar metabolism
MIPAERRQKMLLVINQQGIATTAQLSDQFAVSEMTIHRDIKVLESIGRVEKTYGGVIVRQAQVVTEFERRRLINIEAKQMIGKAAAALVDDGDTILVDASSTCLQMIPDLALKNNLTVFTTGLLACLQLSTFPNIELHSTGGLVPKDTNSFTGAIAIETLKNIHVDKCFMGAAGIHTPYGITDPFLSVAEVKKFSAESSNEVFVLADRSKLGRVTRFNVLPFKEIDLIITDADESTPCVKEIRDQKVELLLVNLIKTENRKE